MAEDTRPVVDAGEPIRPRPTIYMGAQFRSRLEARWAAMFDLLGWTWEYEPLELGAYIPDFVLMLPHAPLLVEVKPALTVDEMQEHTAKIEASGWDREALIVGATMTVRGEWTNCIGILAERIEGQWIWGDALMHWCAKCKGVSIHHAVQSYRCRVNGCYDGDHYLWTLPDYSVERMWRHTGAATQWRPAA